MKDVAVIVPTLRRPDSLARALTSLNAQVGVGNRLAEVVVVDNDPAGSARATVDAANEECLLPFLYRHVPTPGVATARNAGLAATSCPLIAFLDDDEEASPGWLAALLAARESTGADAVFGPIRGQAPDAAPWSRPYLERFFGREGPARDQLIDEPWGCGNSLLLRASALPGDAPFAVAADHSGGEDDALFSALAERGGRFGWAADAWVDEFAPAHRATLDYALRRAFAYGQGPSQTAARHKDWLGVARWMAVGAVQSVVWGITAGALTLIASPRRADILDRAARGLGKVLWMPAFEPRFYGAAEVARLDRAG